MSNSNDRIGFNDGLGFDQDNIISEWNADLEAVKRGVEKLGEWK